MIAVCIHFIVGATTSAMTDLPRLKSFTEALKLVWDTVLQ